MNMKMYFILILFLIAVPLLCRSLPHIHAQKTQQIQQAQQTQQIHQAQQIQQIKFTRIITQIANIKFSQ